MILLKLVVMVAPNKRFLVFISFLFCCQLHKVYCLSGFRKWMRWSTVNVTFGTPVVLEGYISFYQCLANCENSSGCKSAHVNKAMLKCELSTYSPPIGTLSATSRSGWTVYYRDLVEDRAINAWLSVPYFGSLATDAIDGQPDTIATTYGGFQAFAMEFEFPAKVMVVYTHFVEVWWSQNKNFTIQVHPSFDNAKTNVNGTLCVTYTGPGLDKPTNFTCPAAYGKALRIEQFLDDLWASMRMREIKVFY